jgi:sterol desaturase/sphingolipid hydroxylase (fatty acid hydroxylase superfamily)
MHSLTELDPGVVLVNACYAVLVVAVLSEAVWLFLRHGAARLRPVVTAAALGAGAAVTGVAVAAVQVRLWQLVGGAAPGVLERWWTAHPLLGAVAAFVAWDAAGYWYHRIGHRTRVGWASHRVHHSGEHYDLSLAWRQPWLPLHALAVFPLVALGGFDLRTVLLCAAVSNLYQGLLHLARQVHLPSWLTWVVQLPETHRRHHLIGRPTANLGPVLTVWDRLCGTWDPTPVPTDARCGLGTPDGDNPVAIQLAGWRPVADVAKRWRRGLVTAPVTPWSSGGA